MIALVLGIGLAAAAQAQGINRPSSTSSPTMQSQSTQQMQRGTKRVAVRHKITKSRQAMTPARKHTRTAALSRQRTRTVKLRHQQMGTQPVGVGSSNPNPQMTPQTNQLPNSAGGNSITGLTPNTTQPKNQ